MPKTLPEAMVRLLATSLQHDAPAAQLPSMTTREWRRTLNWLDASGLALYFLDAVKALGLDGAVPESILLELEHWQLGNRRRVARMAETFDSLNRRFHEEGVEYAALKGFSLVPDYCPDISLRALSDLDYLVAKNSLERAQQILAEFGFVLKKQTGEEFAFWIPCAEPTRSTDQYSQGAPFMVELHLSVWNQCLCEAPVSLPESSLGNATLRRRNGYSFRVLPEEEAFLAQVLHAFRHLMQGSVRLSWLLELGLFFKQRKDDSALWRKVEQLVQFDAILPEIVGFTAHLAAETFEGPLPDAVIPWIKQIRPAARLWIQHFSRSWLLESFPGYGINFFRRSKLLLFLKEQYIPDAETRIKVRRRSLYPWPGLERLGRPSKKPDISAVESVGQKSGWLVSRLLYHAGTDLRYWWELSRWRRMSQSAGQLSDPAAEQPPSTYAHGRLST